MIVHTLNQNGIIRDANGNFVGVWINNILHIDTYTLYIPDMETMMDKVAELTLQERA